VLKAVVDALAAYPVLNASIDGDNVVYRKDVNLGVAVALDWGLIVPVIHHADEKSVLGLARAVNDIAERARAKKLKVEEVQGGTFTVTNPGVFGSLFGTPIINQPQVAILGLGTIEKRPVVRDDAIAIRTMAYVALTFDHRLVDGADADRFIAGRDDHAILALHQTRLTRDVVGAARDQSSAFRRLRFQRRKVDEGGPIVVAEATLQSWTMLLFKSSIQLTIIIVIHIRVNIIRESFIQLIIAIVIHIKVNFIRKSFIPLITIF
jgi:hypothetical protein